MNEEEKNVETIIDEIESENDVIIEPETEDDVREAFEINKDGPLAALGAPLIRALGDPDPADMTMIHKHLDNFLAKIAGETPIDENVRDSTEYWLNRIAESGGGGGETKLYMHVIRVRAQNTTHNEGLCQIVTNDETPFTLDTFCAWLLDRGVVGGTTGSNKVLPATGLAFGTSPAGIVIGLYKRSGETQLIMEVVNNQFDLAFSINPNFVSDTVIPIN